MTSKWRWFYGAVLAALAGCSSPTYTIARSEDGMLILGGEYPTDFDAALGSGTISAKGHCITLTLKGTGDFQPVFRKGSTRTELERQLGDLAIPRPVSFGGLDTNFLTKQGLDKSPAVSECLGVPAISSGFFPPPMDARPRRSN